MARQTHFHRARTHNNDGHHTTAVYVRAVVCTYVCEQTGFFLSLELNKLPNMTPSPTNRTLDKLNVYDFICRTRTPLVSMYL